MEARQRVKLSLTNRSSGLISAFTDRQIDHLIYERRAQQQACAQDTSIPSQNLPQRHRTVVLTGSWFET